MTKLCTWLVASMLLCTLAFASNVRKSSTFLSQGQTLTMERGDLSLTVTSQADADQALAGTGQTLTTRWRSGGVNREINTTRHDNEGGPNGAARWAERHKQAETAALQLWPPDPA
jgi:hypothetical protein